MWTTPVKRYLSQTFRVDLPTFLFRKLERASQRVGLLKGSSPGCRRNGVRVFDLANCGPRHRFMILGHKPTIVSNCVQSTAHYILVLHVTELARRLKERGIAMTPIIADFHDQAILQVPADRAAEGAATVNEVTAWVNETIGATVKLKAEPTTPSNLAEAKMPEEWAKHVKGSSSNKC